MVIGIIGESCTGKSTLAEALAKHLKADIYSGKDYLRLAKSESDARNLFTKMLADAMNDSVIIYVISEKEHISLLPKGAIRVLVTAELETIKKRFAQRMGGNLPTPVAAMLERKHGCFDKEEHHIHVESGKKDIEEVCTEILGFIK